MAKLGSWSYSRIPMGMSDTKLLFLSSGWLVSHGHLCSIICADCVLMHDLMEYGSHISSLESLYMGSVSAITTEKVVVRIVELSPPHTLPRSSPIHLSIWAPRDLPHPVIKIP